MPEEPLGKRIRSAREKRRWSRARLAEKLGVSNETVLRWELQGVMPRLSAQKDLIKLLGLQEDDFQRTEPEKDSPPFSLVAATDTKPEKLSEDLSHPEPQSEILAGKPEEPVTEEEAPALNVQSPDLSMPEPEKGSIEEEPSMLEKVIPVEIPAGKPEEPVTEEKVPAPNVQPTDPSMPESEKGSLEEELSMLDEAIPVSDIEAALPPKEDFKLYRGWRIEKHQGHGIVTRIPRVTVNGRSLPYFGSKAVDTEQQRVYEWGYHGAGPRQLAESILADFFGETYPAKGYASRKDYRALLYEYAFKCEVIGLFSRKDDDEWNLTSYQIKSWLLSLKERGITEKDLLEKVFFYDVETGLVRVDEEVTT